MLSGNEDLTDSALKSMESGEFSDRRSLDMRFVIGGVDFA